MLWHRDSFVLSNSLCQSLEFSFAEFQDRKPFFPKALFRFGKEQPCLIHCLMPKPVKAGFYKALFRFGNGTALSYPIPCAKALNSALPNSRIESRFSPKLCSALAPVQPCLIHCLMPKPVKTGFYKALCRFGTGTALSYPLPYAKAWNSALPNSRIESRFSPKLCVALATVQPWVYFFSNPSPCQKPGT